MAGKNRLMARLVATSATVTPDSDYIATNLTKTQPQAVGLSVYSSIDSLPTSAATGTKAFVTSNSTLYFYNSGWYKIAIINSFNPQWITEPNSEYTLDFGNIDSDLIITVLASDSDDVPITYTVVTDSDFNVAATITHDSDKDNRWVISRVDSESGAGTTGGVIFKASDGINLVQKSVNFLISGLSDPIDVTQSSAGTAWANATISMFDAYGDGGTYSSSYDAAAYRWSLTGHSNLFDGIYVQPTTMSLPSPEFLIIFYYSGFQTNFDNRGGGHMYMYDSNGVILEHLGVASSTTDSGSGVLVNHSTNQATKTAAGSTSTGNNTNWYIALRYSQTLGTKWWIKTTGSWTYVAYNSTPTAPAYIGARIENRQNTSGTVNVQLLDATSELTNLTF